MGNRELIKAAMDAIENARTAGHNVLTADIALSGLSDWHVPVVEIVTLDPDQKNGDIYQQAWSSDAEKIKYAISRQGLSKLAIAAGIIWSANETCRTDNGTCRDYVSFRAVGGIQKPDGTHTFMKSEYDLDMEVVEEELREGYLKKAKGDTEATKWIKDKSNTFKTNWVEENVKKELIQKRKNKLKLCESGAKDRVIRELLGIKATYPLKQIKKPFVILRITVRPDYSDKDVKRAMLAAAIGSMTGIYGCAPQQIGYEEPIDVTDISRQEPEIQQQPEPTDPPEQPEPEMDQAPFDVFAPGASSLIDFQNCDIQNQVLTLRKMSLKKGYDLQGYVTRCGAESIEKFSQDKRDKIFNYLITLPDLGAVA